MNIIFFPVLLLNYFLKICFINLGFIKHNISMFFNISKALLEKLDFISFHIFNYALHKMKKIVYWLILK